MRDDATQVLTGIHAYNFLLQVVTGLHSAIPGETNVQGQFKKAWQAYQETAPRQASQLRVLIEKIVRDSRTVRKNHLQGIGGHSYGSLVRKLLQPAEEARILFVGNGELALSMLPFFSDWQVQVWNRRAAAEKRLRDVDVLAPKNPARAAEWATHMIITTPGDAALDGFWAHTALQNNTVVAHLDRRRERPGHWLPLQVKHNFYSLDDVFMLRAQLSNRRADSVASARRACAKLAERYGIAQPTVVLGAGARRQVYS